MAEATVLLSPTWQTQIKFLVPDFGPIKSWLVGIGEVNQQMGAFPLYLLLSVSLKYLRKYKVESSHLQLRVPRERAGNHGSKGLGDSPSCSELGAG